MFRGCRSGRIRESRGSAGRSAEAGPSGVDGSYLTDAKDTILEALTDLSAAEAFNASPPQFVVPTKTLLEMRDKAEGKVTS